VGAQPRSSLIGRNRWTSSTPEPESIDILEPRGMRPFDWSVSSRNCWGTTSTWFHLLIPGTLAPLAGLNQLQSLNVSYTNFTGQLVSDFFWRQPGSSPIGWFQGHWLLWQTSANYNRSILSWWILLVSQFPNLFGHNQHVISLADSRNTGSFGKS